MEKWEMFKLFSYVPHKIGTAERLLRGVNLKGDQSVKRYLFRDVDIYLRGGLEPNYEDVSKLNDVYKIECDSMDWLGHPAQKGVLTIPPDDINILIDIEKKRNKNDLNFNKRASFLKGCISKGYDESIIKTHPDFEADKIYRTEKNNKVKNKIKSDKKTLSSIMPWEKEPTKYLNNINPEYFDFIVSKLNEEINSQKLLNSKLLEQINSLKNEIETIRNEKELSKQNMAKKIADFFTTN